MKNALALVAVGFSAVALVVSVWTFTTADARAEAAVRAREAELIARLKPVLIQAYEDLDTPLAPGEADPQSLEALFAPMFRLYRGFM